jgi:hypothetical protein
VSQHPILVTDLGPFRSAVYLAGPLTINLPNVCFATPNTDKIVHWDFDGLKVEAITVAAEEFKKIGGLSIATDDELYNGIWRPVSRSRETSLPSLLLLTHKRTCFEIIYLRQNGTVQRSPLRRRFIFHHLLKQREKDALSERQRSYETFTNELRLLLKQSNRCAVSGAQTTSHGVRKTLEGPRIG